MPLFLTAGLKQGNPKTTRAAGATGSLESTPKASLVLIPQSSPVSDDNDKTVE